MKEPCVWVVELRNSVRSVVRAEVAYTRSEARHYAALHNRVKRADGIKASAVKYVRESK